MNNDHSAFLIALPLFLCATWFAGMFYFSVSTKEARAGELISYPTWFHIMGVTFILYLFFEQGFVRLADQMTQRWSHLFPLVYLELLVSVWAGVGVFWQLVEGKETRWPMPAITFLTLSLLTYVAVLNNRKGDPSSSSSGWLILISIFTFYLLIRGITKKEKRKEFLVASLWSSSVMAWLALTTWLAQWIS